MTAQWDVEAGHVWLSLRTVRLTRDALRKRVGDPFPTPTEPWESPRPEDFA